MAAFIEDKCYGISKVNDGFAIISVSKAGIYKIKSYTENKDGTYTQPFKIINTVTITNPNSIATVIIKNNTYGEDGSWGDLSFGGTTDTQFANIISALDEGEITTSDLPWRTDNSRKIHLSAMPATYVGESHPEQDVAFVIQKIGGVTLTNGKECHYVFAMKDVLSNYGYMNPTPTTVGSWKESARRKWCNDTFRNAIPEPIRSCFKQFKCITATEYNSDTVTTTDDYFALPAEKEMHFGSYCTTAEYNALKYFDGTNPSFKTIGSNYAAFWTRSPDKNNASNFCYIQSSGVASSNSCKANETSGISPFGCI